METLTAELPRPEKLKSFDIMANVDAMQLDLALFGRVLPETREQVTNEQLTFLIEAVNRAARTPFTLQRGEDGDLVYFDDGQQRSYGSMVTAGREAAEHDAGIDPRRNFLANWAQNDYYHYLQMRKLAPGDKYSWSSSYAHEEEKKFGAKFMAECGLQPDRKMGFLYQATCQEDGSVLLESQTIDESDSDAIAAAMDLANKDPSADLDDLVVAHDGVLTAKYGRKFYAGRENEGQEQNAWNEILANSDLTNYLIDGLEEIAEGNLPREDAELRTKRHIYGVWALFKKRLDGTAQPIHDLTIKVDGINVMPPPQALLDRQVRAAYTEFVGRGEVMSGCGGAVSFKNESDVMNADPKDVFNSIFSGKASEDKFGSLDFDCPHCHKSNTRPRGKLIQNCHHCHKDVSCK